MTVRLHPPVSIPARTRTVNGRTYTGTPGTPLDVPDFDHPALVAGGWLQPLDTPGVTTVGTTAQRPGTLANGSSRLGINDVNTTFIDTTIGAVIFWDGATWRHTVTSVAV